MSRTNRNRPWDKWDPSPGQNETRPWDKPAFLCLIPQSNRHFVPFVPGTGGGSSLGRLSHKGRQKNVYMCFLFIQRAANGGLDALWLDLAFLGRPDFQSRGPQICLFLKGFGTSGRKIRPPQKRQIQPRRIQPPICGPLIYWFLLLPIYSTRAWDQSFGHFLGDPRPN